MKASVGADARILKKVIEEIYILVCCSRVLLTTDILARGIDVPEMSLVINYDLPTNRELYIHRLVNI